MPIIQPSIVVPDDIYDDYLAGKIDIMGLAKRTDTSRIVRHLDTIPEGDDTEDANGESLLFTVGVAVLTALAITVTGVTIRMISKSNQKKVEEFKHKLTNYITAVNEQTLTVEIIDDLIASMDKLKRSTRKKVCIQFSTDELSALIECLCNHTHALAEANNIDVSCKDETEKREDILLRLRKNLMIQRDIFSQAA